MKKIIAMILSLAMLLCAVSAMAEDKVTLGTVSINGVLDSITLYDLCHSSAQKA